MSHLSQDQLVPESAHIQRADGERPKAYFKAAQNIFSTKK